MSNDPGNNPWQNNGIKHAASVRGERAEYLQTQPAFKEQLCDPECVIHKLTKAAALVHNCFPYGSSPGSVCLPGTLHKQIPASSRGLGFHFPEVTTALAEVQHSLFIYEICSFSQVKDTPFKKITAISRKTASCKEL